MIEETEDEDLLLSHRTATSKSKENQRQQIRLPPWPLQTATDLEQTHLNLEAVSAVILVK